MTPTKPFYLSKTVIGAIVSGIVYIAGLGGYHIADLAPQMLDAISKQIDATVTIAGLVFTIYGRFAAKKQVTLGPTPSAGKAAALLGLLAVGAAASVTLVGCSESAGIGSTTSSTGTNTNVGQQILNIATPFIAQAAGAGAVIATVDEVGGKSEGPTKPQVATDWLTISSAGYTITTGQATSPQQILAIFESFKSNSNTTSFDSEAQAAANDLSAFIAAHPGSLTQTILTNFFEGAQVTAQALGGATPSTTSLRDGAGAARVAHNHEVGGSSPSPATFATEDDDVR